MQRANFRMEYENITMVRGNTVSFNAEVYNGRYQLINVNSASFTCKKDPAGLITVFEKTLGSGITQVNGIITVRISPSDTANVEAGRYYYEFRIGSGSDIFTIMIGILDIEQNVAN